MQSESGSYVPLASKEEEAMTAKKKRQRWVLRILYFVQTGAAAGLIKVSTTHTYAPFLSNVYYTTNAIHSSSSSFFQSSLPRGSTSRLPKSALHW
jgi:hypothetical protein